MIEQDEQLYAVADSIPEESQGYLSPKVPYKIVEWEEDSEGERECFTIINDIGSSSLCLVKQCAHLNGASWNFVKATECLGGTYPDPVILSERERLERDIVTHARSYVRAKEAPNVSSQRAYIKLAQSIADLAQHENNYGGE